MELQAKVGVASLSKPIQKNQKNQKKSSSSSSTRPVSKSTPTMTFAQPISTNTRRAEAPARPTSSAVSSAAAPLHVDPSSPHIDGEPFVRAEQCIALLQRRLIKPLSRGGPRSELTLTQYHALSFLAARGQASVTELKEILGFAQSTTSVLVDKLARLGLVEKQRDRRDHRVACVVPMPKGLRMVQRYRKNAERNLLALQSVLGDGAVRDVFEALERALVATAPLEDPAVARAASDQDAEAGDDDDALEAAQ
ncbi:MAG: MarR family winged helix-turn-helix transcriptional regulator [Deltaproteobacteria bacterium]|nr:MarR family winged helix-turn-helix transcriptional regulator [Deltaproteobacteria bacterium]